MENGNRVLKNNKSNNIIIILLLVIILILISVIVILIINKDKKEDDLKGIWTTDKITYYEFDGKGSGSLKIPNSEYKFTYILVNNKIYIDYESEEATDSDYEYLFKDNKLILKGIKITTGEYELIKDNN